MGLWDGYDSFLDRIWTDSWSDTETNTAQGRLGRLDGNFNQQAENYTATQAREASDAAVAAVSATAESVISSVAQAQDAAAARLSKNSALKQLKSKPVKFNPPLHRSVRPKRSPYSPAYSSSDLSSKVFDTPEARTSKDWRLGQLVGANEVVGAFKDKKELDHRFGFRFLYNPTSISMNASINSKISPSALRDGSGTLFITGAGLGSVSMEILLNRIPEVSAPRGKKGKDLTDDEKDLRDKGTMVDLDYLFRVANGTWDVTTGYGAPIVGDRGKDKKGNPKNAKVLQTIYTSETGDIGMVVPTPMWLSIGPGLRYYGWLQEVTHKHTMFSPDMVPMVTRVQLVFQRLNKGSQAEFDQLNEAASQYGVINGDVTSPPPDTTAVAPDGSSTGGGYPAVPKWESSFYGQNLPGPKDGYKNVIASARAVFAKWPKIKTVGGFRPSDPYPDHPSGLALDIMMPGGCAAAGSSDYEMGNEIAKFFMENKKRFGVYYIIWQQKIWNSENDSVTPPPQWEGMDDRGSCTANHGDHVHLALYAYPNSKDWGGQQSGSSRQYDSLKQVEGSYWTEESVVVGGSATQTAPGGVDYDGWRPPANRIVNPGGYDFGAPRDYEGYPGLGHTGEDYSLGKGTNLYAMTHSKVVYVDDGIGRVVMRTNVPGGTLNICYLHTINRQVHEGQVLSRGDHVADVGGAGGYPVHLHLDFWWGSDTTPYGADLLDPNVVLRALFGKTPGDESPKANYSPRHLNFVRNRLGGTTNQRSRTKPYGSTGT